MFSDEPIFRDIDTSSENGETDEKPHSCFGNVASESPHCRFGDVEKADVDFPDVEKRHDNKILNNQVLKNQILSDKRVTTIISIIVSSFLERHIGGIGYIFLRKISAIKAAEISLTPQHNVFIEGGVFSIMLSQYCRPLLAEITMLRHKICYVIVLSFCHYDERIFYCRGGVPEC